MWEWLSLLREFTEGRQKMSRTRGALYAERRAFVESTCKNFLSPMKGFESIVYGRRYGTDEEFVRVSDKMGTSLLLDVTALSKSDIVREICKIALFDELGTVPENIVSDKSVQMRASELFK